jgi:hypothetical protein
LKLFSDIFDKNVSNKSQKVNIRDVKEERGKQFAFIIVRILYKPVWPISDNCWSPCPKSLSDFYFFNYFLNAIVPEFLDKLEPRLRFPQTNQNRDHTIKSKDKLSPAGMKYVSNGNMIRVSGFKSDHIT